MKKRFHLLLTIPVLFVLGTSIAVLSLPYLLDLYLFPRILSDLPFANKEVSLSRISPWKIRGTVILADGSSSLEIPKFELSYTPASLLNGRVKELLLDSMSINLEIENGKPIFRGWSNQGSAAKKKNNTSSLISPLAVETIIIKNCSISWNSKEQQTFLKTNGLFTVDFQDQEDKQKKLAGISGVIQLSGAIDLQGTVSLKMVDDSTLLTQLELKTDDIGQLRGLRPELSGVQLAGGMAAKAEAHLNLLKGRIDNFKTEVLFPGFHLKKETVTIEAISPDTPATLNLRGTPEAVHFNLANVALIQPERVALVMEGDLDPRGKTLEGRAQLSLTRTNSTVKISYQGGISPEGIGLNYQLAGAPFEIRDFLVVSAFMAEGGVVLQDSSMEGSVKVTIPNITFAKNETELINLSLQIPVQYPLPAAKNIADNDNKNSEGILKINKIIHKGANSGQLRIDFRPTNEKISFNTLLTSPFVPGLRLTCTGNSRVTGNTSIFCNVPTTDIDSSTLPSFAKIPGELSFHGKIAAKAQLHLTDRVPTGTLQLDFQKGGLIHGDNKLSDINVQVNFPNLPLLQSSPSQECSIGSLELGTIKMSDARVHFRIENSQAIFLEKSRLNWCGGKVETGSFRLATDMEELETTLYCDRLGFTELLAQFGINQTEGQGALNGRLPIKISKQRLVFDDGFLFSTPGNSGIIRFNDTNQLRQGIPGISQSSYLDYSMKALENFSYNWTKLSFNSVGDDLLIAMQLDGKPAEPLPYGYQKGQIVPTTKGPGLQHPIRLDVNFRLPLQDMFKYGQNIQSIMENM